MTKPQVSDSTVQPASRTMPSNGVLAKLFSELASHDRLIHTLYARIRCLEERLSYLERKDDESQRLKDENLALKQMVAGDSLDCLSVEDYSAYGYSD